MSDIAPGSILEEARIALVRAVLDEPLSSGERAYLASTASRLAAMAAALQEGRPEASRTAPEPEAEEIPKPPRRLYTRSEAAELVGVHANTLLNWEARGLLQARRDHRGWRVYGREELARAMALAAHIPLASDTH
jgi:hypothetical protein